MLTRNDDQMVMDNKPDEYNTLPETLHREEPKKPPSDKGGGFEKDEPINLNSCVQAASTKSQGMK